MASGIAHDFNNMLTSVGGFISLAKMNLKAGRPAIQELEKAEKMALRSSELSDTLITFSRGNKPVKKKVQIHDFLMRSLLMGQRSVSASPVGSPATIARMLDFAARHDIKPVIETYPMEQVNDAMERLRSGQARYRIVLSR